MVGDFKYIINNTVLDAEDVVTSPLYVASPNSALYSPKFYLVLAGLGRCGVVLTHWIRP